MSGTQSNMYIIKIEEVQPTDGATYEKTKTIYEQRIGDLDIEAVIKAANKIQSL
jgi:hypothetical protein